MTVATTIAHQMPGRVRLRTRERPGTAADFSRLAEQLSDLDRVKNVKANPSTGSIVIEFSGAFDDLVELLREYGLLVEKEPGSGPGLAAAAPGVTAARPFNLISGRDINPMFMLGSLLFTMAVVQTFRREIMVPAIPAYMYAMDAFRRARKARE